MKNVIWLLMITMYMLYACGGNTQNTEESTMETDLPESIQEGRGIGEYDSVELSDPLDEAMIAAGKQIFEKQCRDCHKLDNSELLGPGFQDITNKRRPEWIMNMMTNTKLMLELDPTARELLKLADRRAMPHQHLDGEGARAMLEFLRSNDLALSGRKDGAVSTME
jgi:hypothetical protein